MGKGMKKTVLFFISLFLVLPLFAQYTVNGNASRDNCRCYTLTQNQNFQSGSVWNNNKIDLSQSFTFTFEVFLGCSDGGADGIAFVLQPISTSVGGNGNGMGYGGITPAVAVTLDTYQNGSPDNDPFYDHIAIQMNGDVVHTSPNTLTPLTPISATSNNVEDCNTHTLKIAWNAVTRNLDVWFDDQPRVNATNDFVNTIFGGNNFVYWGFTGATVGATNLQRFCTSLTPGFRLLPDQKRCAGEAIPFFDSTTTFGGVLKRYWNFGDGSPIDSVNINPVHTYSIAGDYTVTLRIIALDSCEETITQPLRIGSKPIPGFSTIDSCVSNSIQFSDTSQVTVGSINQWYWNFDNAGLSSTAQNPVTTYSTPGDKTIRFVVKTLEGCTSDTLVKIIRIRDRPVIDFTFTDSVCLGTPTRFFENCSLSDGPVNFWSWTYSDSSFSTNVQDPVHIFTNPGTNTVTLTASGTGVNACLGTSVTKTVFVTDKPKAGIRQVNGCELQPIQLQDSSYTTDGLNITGWWWDLGNGQFSNLQNPFVNYAASGPKTIQLVVYNARNCASDTLERTINIGDKPIVKFGLSEPECNDNRIFFTDSSSVSNGAIAQWQWISQGTVFSASPQATGVFTPGPQQAGLSVTSSIGCKSDTLFRPFIMKTTPVVEMNFADTCKYAPVVFSANETSTNTGIILWNWEFGDGQAGNGNNTTHVYTMNGEYTVSLYGISAEGCSSDTIVERINIYGTDAFAGNDTIAAALQPIRLNATGGMSYEWSPSEGLSATNISNPLVTITEDKTYYLKAYTPGGCESYDTINIKIYKGPELYVPGAFSPNGDGLNDVLRVIPIGIRQLNNFTIYNRFGEKIFSTSDASRGWDGTLKGAAQQTGTYVWFASGIDFRGKPISRKGSVLIIR